MILLICVAVLAVSVGQISGKNEGEGELLQMSGPYSESVFSSIVVGESDLWDVNRIAIAESIMVTSYGAYGKYLIEDGQHIYIKFFGKDMIVSSIEKGQ